MNFLGTVTLETDRLILRKLKIEDAYRAFENWCSDDDVVKYVLWEKHDNVDTTLNQYSKWIEDYDDLKTFRWVVELKDNHDVIGMIDVSKKFMDFGSCGIGYCFSKKYWNKGYATETLKAVIKFLFEQCEAETIYASFMSNNPASGRVMEKSGLKYEGILRSRTIDKNLERNDLISYSLTKQEYFELNNMDLMN